MDGSLQESPVLPARDPAVRVRPERLLRRRAVGGEVVLAAEQVVIDPGWVWKIGPQVDRRRPAVFRPRVHPGSIRHARSGGLAGISDECEPTPGLSGE